MPERVVDALEVVEVEEEHRDVRPRALAAEDERVLDAVREERTVREARKRVVERLVPELLLGFLARGDVEQVALQDVLVAVADDPRFVLHPEIAAASGAEPVLDKERLAGRVRSLVRSEDAFAILGMEQLHEEVVVLGPLGDGVAEHRLDLRARVDVRADIVEPVDVDGQRQLLDERAETGLADARGMVGRPLHLRLQSIVVPPGPSDPSIGLRRSRGVVRIVRWPMSPSRASASLGPSSARRHAISHARSSTTGMRRTSY